METGKIEPGVGPWNSASFPVPKKKPGEYRLVEDFRDVNNATEDDAHPLPRIDAILQRQGAFQMWSTLDLKDGYHQMPLKEEHRYITCMSTPRGTMQWRVLVMGLKNGNAMFQRMMEWVLRDHPNADPYVDDIIIGSTGDTEEELLANHEADIRGVLETLRENCLVADWEKARLFMREVEFCGHILREGRRGPAPGKLLSIQGWELPKTVTALRGFLGLTNYYSCYVKNYANLAAPLMSKLQLNREDGKKGSQKPIRWTTSDIESFVKLKRALTEELELFQLEPDQPFVMKTDASDHAIGAVLEQEREGKMVPVAFFSRKLGGSQLNWTAREKETYAIVSALRKWAGWIGFQPVLIKTDHRSLEDWVTEHVDTPSGPRGRRARWHETLSQFNLEVQYLPGKDNIIADVMSRFAYPASSAREDVSFHGSATAHAEMQSIIDREVREGRMVGVVTLGGWRVEDRRPKPGCLCVMGLLGDGHSLATHVRAVVLEEVASNILPPPLSSSSSSSGTGQSEGVYSQQHGGSPELAQSAGASSPLCEVNPVLTRSGRGGSPPPSEGDDDDDSEGERPTTPDHGGEVSSPILSEGEDECDRPVTPNTKIHFGVTMEEWSKILQEGLKGDPTPSGTNYLFFPANLDWQKVEVVVELDVKKCLGEGIEIFQNHRGDFYTPGVTEQTVIPPSYFLRALTTHDAATIFPEVPEAISGSEIISPPQLPDMTKFYFQTQLPPELRTQSSQKKRWGKRVVAPPPPPMEEADLPSQGSEDEGDALIDEGDGKGEDEEDDVARGQPLSTLDQAWGQAYQEDLHWQEPWLAMQDPNKEWPEGYRLILLGGSYKMCFEGRVCVPFQWSRPLMADLHVFQGHLGVTRLIMEWRRRYHLTPSEKLIPLARDIKKKYAQCVNSANRQIGKFRGPRA